MDRIFGEIAGVPPGTSFPTRKAVSQAGLHGPWQSGIHGNRREGASSIVVSGGYVDDDDRGDVILYTGHGGRNSKTGRQDRDQSLDDPGNAGLVTSYLECLPIRVIRGEAGGPYVYDGLFRISDYWSKIGSDGFRVWQFQLERLAFRGSFLKGTAAKNSALLTETLGAEKLSFRNPVFLQRVVVSTRAIELVKEMYSSTCQVCSAELEHPGGNFAEGAYLRPIGTPHEGIDSPANILCLCPNHHALLERGGIWVSDDLTVFNNQPLPVADLHVSDQHLLDVANIRYHRSLWGR